MKNVADILEEMAQAREGQIMRMRDALVPDYVISAAQREANALRAGATALREQPCPHCECPEAHGK